MIPVRCMMALGALIFSFATFALANEVDPKNRVVHTEKRAVPARIRVQLRVTPYEKVVTHSPRGVQTSKFQPGQEILHTLRARMDRPNHFYFGEWHVTATPLSWSRESLSYRVRLNFQKIYGVAANLEEAVGDMEVSGHLQKVDDGMYNLVASEKKVFRDLEGNPKLAIVAGFNPAADQERMNVAKRPDPTANTQQAR